MGSLEGVDANFYGHTGADFTMLDCPPTAPDFGDDGDDDGFGNTPAMDANVHNRISPDICLSFNV